MFSFWRKDVTGLLPAGWQEDSGAVAADADFRAFPRTAVLSREAPEVTHIERGRVHAGVVMERLPWLYRMYREEFLELAADAWGESLEAAQDDRYGVVLNVQRGKRMRFECHVDSNPVTGVLFLTSHLAGGELVVSSDPDAAGVDGVERDCSLFRPAAGHLILFSGFRPHYVRPLASESDTRIAAVMNFYTREFPESARPPELNRHLFGDP